MRSLLPWTLATLLAGVAGFALGGAPGARTIPVHVTARRYAFDPPVIRANAGDTLRLSLSTRDVLHGFRLDGHDLDVTITPGCPEVQVRMAGRSGVVRDVPIRLERPGRFGFRCSELCGPMHPFMTGELVVGPRAFPWVALAVAWLLPVALLVSSRLRARGGRRARHAG